jgi:hypothetical protein
MQSTYMAAQGNVPKGAEKIAKRLECSSTTSIQNMKKKTKKKMGSSTVCQTNHIQSGYFSAKWTLQEVNLARRVLLNAQKKLPS